MIETKNERILGKESTKSLRNNISPQNATNRIENRT
jgi:hypothetical protein